MNGNQTYISFSLTISYKEAAIHSYFFLFTQSRGGMPKTAINYRPKNIYFQSVLETSESRNLRTRNDRKYEFKSLSGQ